MATATIPEPGRSIRDPRPAAGPPATTRSARRRARAESLAIFVLFAAVYGALGYRSTITDHVIVFDSLDRLARAYMVFWNSPPKLAAVGFVFPPMTTLVYLPLAIVKPLATSLVALPVLSALFAAGTMVVLNLTFRRCTLPAPMRYALLLAFGANPLWIFYAGNGTGDTVYLFFLAFGVMAFINWYCTEEVIHLMGAGTALGIASLTRYGLLSWTLLTALLVAAALARRGADREEAEGSVITYAAPTVYAVALWTLFNAVIVSSPFGWLRPSGTTLAVNSVRSTSPGSAGFIDVISHTLTLVASVAPLAFVVLFFLVIAFALKRDDLALWLAGLVALSIALVLVAAVFSDDISKIVLRAALPVALTALFGGAWIYRASNGLRVGVFALTLGFLLVSLPLTWHQMQRYPYQNQEQAFVRSLFSGKDQNGALSRGGFTTGIREESAMAARIKRLVGGRRDAVLTDNAQTYAIVLLSGRPDIFLDRVDKGDSGWRRVLAAPEGRVRYMLLATGAGGDLIRMRYPQAAEGSSARFVPVYRTGRYVLVRVRAAARRGRARRSGAPAVQNATPTRTPAERTTTAATTPTTTPPVPAP